MIRRAKSRHRYTSVSNAVVEDVTLSWGARGLLLYLLSKPDHWQVKPAAIVSQGPLGRDGVYALLRELKEAGYIVMRRLADGSTSYTVFDSPQDAELGEPTSENQQEPETEFPDEGGPSSGKAISGKAISGNSARLVNTEKAVNTEKEREPNGADAPSSPGLFDPARNEPGRCTFATYVAYCRAIKRKVIPADHPIFDWAKKQNLPVSFLRLAWQVFEDRFTTDEKAKRKLYTDWPATFANYVRYDYLHLWYLDKASGEYTLTVPGRQFDREFNGEQRDAA